MTWSGERFYDPKVGWTKRLVDGDRHANIVTYGPVFFAGALARALDECTARGGLITFTDADVHIRIVPVREGMPVVPEAPTTNEGHE